MTKTSPETHLLRELHVLASPFTLIVGLATASIWNVIGPGLVAGTFLSLFVFASISFALLGALRGRRFGVRIGIWSTLVSGVVNAVAIGSLILAFRIWYLQWPFNQGPTQPEDYIDDGGASWFITLGLVTLSSLIWALGIFAVGAAPAKKVPQAEGLK